ncbi:Hypothetical predicted protein [Scomber scombrus]|uniref:Uncharacterized protein n=1 Tax=Scomber scombrus TaxID=13677 RepID=A0AAV1Q4U6_SCOSC
MSGRSLTSQPTCLLSAVSTSLNESESLLTRHGEVRRIKHDTRGRASEMASVSWMDRERHDAKDRLQMKKARGRTPGRYHRVSQSDYRHDRKRR